MNIYTSKIGGSRNRASRIDITVKSAVKPYDIFAPTWKMVDDWKHFRITREEYIRQYYDLMRLRYVEYPDTFMDLINRDSVTLCCYCLPGDFCHRLLLVDILQKIGKYYGIEVIYKGEI